MSVTIVSTLPAPKQSAATDSGSEAGSTQGFADLLSDQMALSDPQAIATNALTTSAATDAASLLATLGLVAPKDATLQKGASTLSADAAPADAASLLAALGLAQGQAAVPTSDSAPGSEKSTDALSAVSGRAAQTLNAEGQSPILKAEQESNAAALADNQAAKFAATLATAAENAGVKTDSVDAAADGNGILSLATHVVNNTGSHPIQHDSSLSVHTPVHDQRWTSDFNQKVVWLATNDKQSAQLTLNPPHMGPIEISLNVDNGSASVSFASANAEVRDAIETALPRLREMFASAGIELGQTNVSSESFRQQGGNGEPYPSSSKSTSDNAILAENTPGSLHVKAFQAQRGNGLVNTFA